MTSCQREEEEGGRQVVEEERKNRVASEKKCRYLCITDATSLIEIGRRCSTDKNKPASTPKPNLYGAEFQLYRRALAELGDPQISVQRGKLNRRR